jgi:hypothetical protein
MGFCFLLFNTLRLTPYLPAEALAQAGAMLYGFLRTRKTVTDTFLM